MFKKLLLTSVVVMLVITLLAACAPKATPTPEPMKIKVAVVAGGEIGDKGFIDSANEGLKRIESELGLETMLLQGRDEPDRYLDLLLSAGEEADLVFVVPGYFFMEQQQQVVPQFPDTTFVFVDGVTDIAGMSSIKYLENEGSFLAGALAALLTTRTSELSMVDGDKVVGQMGGADMPVIHNFMVGFEQGAKYVDPDVKVITRFAGTHFDPAKGRETALAMYGEGVDVLFQIAGPTGLGVFEAAKEANRYVIGVDGNQKPLAPDNTVASMRKRVGDSLLNFTKLYVNGEIKSDEAYFCGLAKNGVGLDYGEMDPDLVPQDVKDKIAEP